MSARLGVASHSNTVTALEVGDDAEVTWVIVQEEGEAAIHLAQLNVSARRRCAS